jgi:protein-disulfide isomerase
MPKKNNKNLIITISIAVFLSVSINLFINKFFVKQNSDVLSYIENNADKVVEAIEKFYAAKAKHGDKNRDKNISSMTKDLYGKNIPVVGNKNAKNKIVEFYDFNCGYCKRAYSDLAKVAKNRKDVAVYFIDFPILGASSLVKAKASIAANILNSKNYFKFHGNLIAVGNVGENEIFSIARANGYDPVKFKETYNSSKVRKIIENNKEMAKKLNVNGTPAFIINKSFFPGAIDYNSIIKSLK